MIRWAAAVCLLALVGPGQAQVVIDLGQGNAYLSAVSTLLPAVNGSSSVNTTIPIGSSALLTWDTSPAIACTGVGFPTGSTAFGSITVSPTTTTTYSINCAGAIASATVNISGNVIIGLTPAAATTFCASHGGGSGTSGSPWTRDCIQAAFDAAADGDTVFLAAGNWALPISTTPATSSKSLNLIGAGTGDTFTAGGHPVGPTNAATDATRCPTASSSITCVYPTGTAVASGGPGGYILYNSAVSCAGITVANIYFDASLTSAGGANTGLLTFWHGGSLTSCANSLISNIHLLSYNNNPNLTAESQLTLNDTLNMTVQNSVIAAPPAPLLSSFYSQDIGMQINQGRYFTWQNNYFFQTYPLEEANSDEVQIGNTVYVGTDTDGTRKAQIRAQMGMDAFSIGPAFNITNDPGTIHDVNGNGDINWTARNNHLISTGQPVGIGGGAADLGGGAGIQHPIVTGNTVEGTIAAVDGCNFHAYNPATGMYDVCPPGVPVTSASWSANQVTFVVPSTPNVLTITVGGGNGVATFYTSGFLPVGFNSSGAYQNYGWTATSVTCGGGSCTIVASQPVNPGASVPTRLGFLQPSGWGQGMQMNGQVNNDCTQSDTPSPDFIIQNNSVIGTVSAQLDASGTGITSCWTTPFNLNTPTTHNSTVVNFKGSQNYLSSPTNLYVSDVNTHNAVVSNNVGDGANGQGQMDVPVSSFTAVPTCSFTLGTLSNGTVLIASTSFTAQYGAVRWIVSNSPTTPLSSDSRWQYVPPVSLSSVAHGNTVYMWVMDSVNHISAAASAALP
jgi:hypothetical protein